MEKDKVKLKHDILIVHKTIKHNGEKDFKDNLNTLI